MIMTWIKAGVVAVAVGGAAFAGWSWRDSRCEAVRQAEISSAVLAALSQYSDKQGSADEYGKKLEKALASQKERNRYLVQQLETEIAKQGSYRDCIVDDGSVHIINEAIGAGRSQTAR